jgi:hypothetical protein
LYANSDGTYTVRNSPTQINVADASDKIIPIDAKLRPAEADLETSVTRGAQGKVAARQVPAFTTGAHPLRPVFGATAKGGAVSVVANATSVVDTPVDAPDDDAQGPRPAGGQVVFTKAVGGSDLVYEVTKDAVKETIMVRGPPGERGVTQWSFWLDITGGTPTVVPSGAIEITNPAGRVTMALPVPYIQDSAGLAGVREPNDTNGRYLLEQVDGRWRLTVTVDPDWLNRKDIVYPVRVDPTLATPGYDAIWAIKNDGTVVQDGQARIGSPNSAGGMWRGFIHYDWSGLLNAGNQVVDATSAMAYMGGGTANAYPSSVNHSTAVNYGGIGQELGSGDFGTSVYYGGAPMTNFMRGVFANNNPYPVFMFRGHEITSMYTYKRILGDVYLTINRPAHPATHVAPAHGATHASLTPTLQATGSDPEGDPVQYRFQVSTHPDVGNNVMWESPWAFSNQTQIPSNLLSGNTWYYWRILTRDYCSADGDPCGYGFQAAPAASAVWQFLTTTPPNPLGSAGALPAAGTVATTTPTLSVTATTDPDGGPEPLRYWFSVTTGPDGRTGTVVSSGWLTSTSWTVPAGYLKDGVSYAWTAWAFDGGSKDQGVWANRLTIDLRAGDPGAARSTRWAR